MVHPTVVCVLKLNAVFSYLKFFFLLVSLQAFRKFDEMNGKLTEQLRKLAKQVLLHFRGSLVSFVTYVKILLVLCSLKGAQCK